jgi:hypothetical protein
MCIWNEQYPPEEKCNVNFPAKNQWVDYVHTKNTKAIKKLYIQNLQLMCIIWTLTDIHCLIH